MAANQYATAESAISAGAGRISPPRSSQIGQQIERIQGLNNQLANLVERLDKQMSAVGGAEPQPGADATNGKMAPPGSALDALGCAITDAEMLVTRLHHQVERVERL